MLDQHTRYALIVTRGVRDASGHRVEASQAFRRFRQDHDVKRYRKELLDALAAARAVGVAEKDIVVASVFTTQSVTAILEKIRHQIQRALPPVADFSLGPDGGRAVYPLNTLTNILVVRQTGTAPSFASSGTPFPVLSSLAPGAIAALAFGRYESPDYLTADLHIPPVPTRRGEPVVQRTNDVFFNLILPAGAPPPSGWPVAIYGHGGTEDKQGTLFVVAGRLALQGIATIGINTVGRGSGPLSTLTLQRGPSPAITLPAGGRGIDVDSNGQIAQPEGHVAPAPRGIIRDRDTKTQTVTDLLQLVRVIESGVDVDGDGVVDLDASRVYYVGWSNGASVGSTFLSVAPTVRAGVLIVPAGPSLEAFRLSSVFRAANVGALLAARVPSLINIGGLDFDENLPMRDKPPLVNAVAGAVEIQELLDNFEWVGQAGDAVPYGMYLRRDPLPGLDQKSVIIQFARGDRSLPNPTTTAVLRAGDLADRATYYRFDLFLADNPGFPPSTDPHGSIHLPPPPFVALPAAVRAAATSLALAAQDQIAAFFASDGATVVDPDGSGPLFETPIVLPLPEEVVFFP